MVAYKLVITSNEAMTGTKKILTRKGKRLEIIIPAGVKTGTLVELSGALQITDGYYGDIFIRIKVKSRNHSVFALATIVGLFLIISSIAITYSIINSGGTTEPTVTPPGSSSGGIGVSPTSDFITVFHDKQPILNLGKESIQLIQLVNNSDATNPTWQQLKDFLRSDKTDQNQYILGSYICVDFAKEVHDNAEAAGIRAAFVGVSFEGEIEGHALNAFETIDKGLVYIDCTELDTIIYIEKGKEYQPISLREPDYIKIEPLGIVEAVRVYWR